jgi:hypothetical protein
MSKVSVIQRADGGVSVCPIMRQRGASETEAQFRHAVTRRVFAEELSAAHGATMGSKELVAYLKQHDDAMTLEAEAAKVGAVVVGILDSADIPAKDEFRNGWSAQGGRIVFDLPKCKAIAHEKRRAARAAEFAPLDIEATIPARAAEAEAKRQAIRESDALKQAAIDAAKSVEEIKAALS